jgi:cytochrome P450
VPDLSGASKLKVENSFRFCSIARLATQLLPLKMIYSATFTSARTGAFIRSSRRNLQKQFQSTTSALTSNEFAERPQLRHVPSLPFVGSIIKQYSGVPGFEPEHAFDNWPKMTKQFGDFYTIGLPGIGSGSHGTIHILQDPTEMMRVLRSEGKFPSSIVTNQWPFHKHFETIPEMGRTPKLLGMGEEWKLIRNFMQKDLLSPTASRRYIPNIVKACKYVSRGIAHRTEDVNMYLNEASFDMFWYERFHALFILVLLKPMVVSHTCHYRSTPSTSTVLLGQFPRLTDPSTKPRPNDVLFCRAVTEALHINGQLTNSLKHTLLVKNLGIETALYKKFTQNWTAAMRIGNEYIREMKEKRAAGQLNEYEEASYWNQAHIRRLEENSELTEQEVDMLCYSMLTASVDTTAGNLAWHLLHMGVNPEKQDKLHDEIRSLYDSCGGTFTEDSFSSAKAPYLHAWLRESHRMTNPTNLVPIRKIAQDLEIYGVVFPAGTTFGFDAVSKSLDPTLVDKPDEFIPERWLPEAVTARKGTRAAMLDHPLFSEPFGQGARRCPGSRVARNEAMVLMSQLVLDWKISVPGVKTWRDVPYGLQTVNAPFLPKMQFDPRISN